MDSHWGPSTVPWRSTWWGLALFCRMGRRQRLVLPLEKRTVRISISSRLARVWYRSRGHAQSLSKLIPNGELRLRIYALPLMQFEAFERGLSPEPWRFLLRGGAWGRRRVGLTDDTPVLVLVEPWALDAGRRLGNVDSFFSERLTRLEPPLGWDVHEGSCHSLEHGRRL